MFPLESYLLAPLGLLPPGAWACRLIPLILGLLTSHGNENMMPQSHAAILLSGQPLEELA